MTFPRKVGLLLLLVAAAAAVARYHELSLPTLRWFYSFAATPEQILDAEVKEHVVGLGGTRFFSFTIDWPYLRQNQAEFAGRALCGVLGFIGLGLLAFGGKFQWNPLTLRRFARFRSIGRGWLSFQLIILLMLLAMLDQALVGKRALAVKYDGRWSFPAFKEAAMRETDFGGDSEQEPNYRQLRTDFAKAKSGNKVILAPIPWDPTFDSDQIVRRTLVLVEGKLHRSGEREPYNGQATQFREDDPEVPVRTALFRKGLRSGITSVFDEKGEFAGREIWKDDKLEQSNVEGNAGSLPAGSWQELIYPPAPPTFASWETSHLLGTDSKGWDIAAQMFGGLQVMFKAAAIYVILTYGIGIVIGCMQGYFGGWFDITSQRISEILSNVPFLLLVMIITANMGLANVTLSTVLLIFCLFSWVYVATYLRTSTFKEKARDYVAAARVQGASTTRIIFRHILPNAISTLVTLLPFSIAGLATSLTALDFLGFGLPERYPSWGRLLDDGTSNLNSPWIVSSVFATMVGVLLLITFIGEAIREAFDPKKFTTYQ
ncbi:ABC transporter permease subunit [Luteolibacter luteus]|uniref:ABC transporter permease subunit n=1 Tax=Luteolibacter luteus TaxID=2728835 RepID=A0A858RMM9_9BACT|nr:ABC transporter permease subunit [Luteolibacter luteus]QJE97744.1 ABC transporter permease subunit [Luteolibacter luteus]